MISECTVADEMAFAAFDEETKRVARIVVRNEIEDSVRVDVMAELVEEDQDNYPVKMEEHVALARDIQAILETRGLGGDEIDKLKERCATIITGFTD